MNLLLAMAVGVFAVWLLAHVIVLFIAVLRASPSKVEELKHLQGSIWNIFRGQLANPPGAVDYRVVQGLEWDGKKKTFVAQSRLSTEALRSTFFQ